MSEPHLKPGDPVWIYPAELDGKPAWAIQRAKTEHSGTDSDTAPEPEPEPEDADADADDVEPEPLKAGDMALVWVRVDKPAMNGGTRVYTITEDGGEWDAITRPDAIVRPDAGQMPPWVNVATANVVAIARVLMDEGGMEHAAAFAHAESLDRAGIRAEGAEPEESAR